jgi:hypothetical protein
MFKFGKIAVSAAVALIVPMSYAAPVPLTMLSAPDSVSRSILARPVQHFEDGAVSPQDIPAAIHRNYPQILEQNFARMNAQSSLAFVDNLSDVELGAMAQLYANANADTQRTGKLLLVAANRMDGAHLARLSKFFGYAPVYEAILQAAPLKAQNFAQNAPVVSSAPVIGAPSPLAAPMRPVSSSPFALNSKLGGGAITPMQFKPSTGMTLDEIYTGFRGMQVGSMGGTAALYESTFYAGTQLTIAWGAGYGFGTGLTYLAQTYIPDWYYGTFVDAVGNTADWFQHVVDTAGNFYGSSIYDLGHYESSTAPAMGVPSAAQSSMQNTGGDFGVTSAWQTIWINPPTGGGGGGGGGGGCAPGEKCPPVLSK